jgi:hypothetical protein
VLCCAVLAGIHFYSGNFMNSEDGSAGPIPNKGGIRYEQHTGGFQQSMLNDTCPCIEVGLAG